MYIIQGNVIDGTSGNGVPGVNVKTVADVTGTAIEFGDTYADAKGRFLIAADETQKCNLVVPRQVLGKRLIPYTMSNEPQPDVRKDYNIVVSPITLDDLDTDQSGDVDLGEVKTRVDIHSVEIQQLRAEIQAMRNSTFNMLGVLLQKINDLNKN